MAQRQTPGSLATKKWVTDKVANLVAAGFVRLNGGAGNIFTTPGVPAGTTVASWPYNGETKVDAAGNVWIRPVGVADVPTSSTPVLPSQGEYLTLAWSSFKASYVLTSGAVTAASPAVDTMQAAIAMQMAVVQADQDAYDRILAYLLANLRRTASTTFKDLFKASNVDTTVYFGHNLQLSKAVIRAWNKWNRASDRDLASELARGLKNMGIANENYVYPVADEYQMVIAGSGGHHAVGSHVYSKHELGNIDPVALRMLYTFTGDAVFNLMINGFYNLLTLSTQTGGDFPTPNKLVPRYVAFDQDLHKPSPIVNGVNGWSETGSTDFDNVAMRTIRHTYEDFSLYGSAAARTFLENIKTFYATKWASGTISTVYTRAGDVGSGASQTVSAYYFAIMALSAVNASDSTAAAIYSSKIPVDLATKTVGGTTYSYLANQIKGTTAVSELGNDQGAWIARAYYSHKIDDLALYGSNANAGTTSPTTGPGASGGAGGVAAPSTTTTPGPVVIPTPTPAAGEEKLFADTGSQMYAYTQTIPANTAKRKAFDYFVGLPSAPWVGFNWDPQGQNVLKPYFDRCPSGFLACWVLYSIPLRDPGQHSAGGANSDPEYNTHVAALKSILVAARAAGKRSINVFEPDSLSQMHLLTAEQQAARYATMNYNIGILAPITELFIDVGHPDWHSATEMASRLRKLGNPEKAAGFSLNVSNFVTFERCVSYGQELLAIMNIPGWQFIIDTAGNGNPEPIVQDIEPNDGQDAARGGKEPWINPPNRWLGKVPRVGATNIPGCRGWMILKRPGESDGSRRGAPAAGEPYPIVLWNDAVGYNVTTKNITTSSGRLQRGGSGIPGTPSASN